MASNDKKTLLKRLANSAGRGIGANAGQGTADVVVPKFPEFPEKLTPDSVRALREELERWRNSLQAQFPIPAQTVQEHAPEVDLTEVNQSITNVTNNVTQIQQDITNIYNQITQIINNYEECCDDGGGGDGGGAGCVAPAFFAHPQTQAALSGTTVILSAFVIASTPFTYQWYKDGVAVPGATSVTLTLSNAQVSDSGTYKLRVTNACGAVESNQAIIAIYDLPPSAIPTAIITLANPATALQGEQVFFSGMGVDPDGFITAYRWTSSIDGQISTAATFDTATLSAGVHTISFEVRDNSGLWSAPDTASIEIIATTPVDPLRVQANRVSVGDIAQDHEASVDANRVSIGVIAQDHSASAEANRVSIGTIAQDHIASVDANRVSIGSVFQDHSDRQVDVNRMSIGSLLHQDDPWKWDIEVRQARVDACSQLGYYGSEWNSVNNAFDRDIEIRQARADACVMLGFFGSEASDISNAVSRDIEVRQLRVDVVAMVPEP